MSKEFQFVLDWGGQENTARILTENGHRARSKAGKATTTGDIYNWRRPGRGVPGWAMELVLALREDSGMPVGSQIFHVVACEDEHEKVSA